MTAPPPSVTSDTPLQLGLVSAPWPLFNRPSLQLGALKSYLDRQASGVSVTVHPFYLHLAEALGYSDYQTISEHMWLAESIFAALLYPDRRDRPKALFRKESRQSRVRTAATFDALVSMADRVSREFVAGIDWHHYQVVGFSVCLCQLTATLVLIRRIKRRHPGLRIVIGGSALAGTVSDALFEVFPGVDYAVTGEGEKPLAALLRHLQTHGTANPPIPAIAGVSAPGLPPQDDCRRQQLPSLEALSAPDFDAYFQRVAAMPEDRRFFPVLPLEASRGCRWQAAGSGSRRGGCAFCNLNRLWQGYRTKPPQQVLCELDHLTSRHQVLSLALADNLLPADAGRTVFAPLSRGGKDLDLFGEIRATTSYNQLSAMAAAGMREVQVGVEALSTRLLQRMNKGTSAIRNLQIMKDCEELGIGLNANLILEFPGSSDREAAETLQAIAFAAPFRPLKPVSFWLGLGSPVWQSPSRYGIRSIRNHHNYHYLFPGTIRSQIDFTVKTYSGDRTAQRRRWRPVRQALTEWRERYDRMRRRSGQATPNLAYRDGGSFLVIRQRRPEADILNHRLTGTSRHIYLYCRRIRSTAAVLRRFPQINPEQLSAFLELMNRKRLMFSENGRHLSLAVHDLPPGAGHRRGA